MNSSDRIFVLKDGRRVGPLTLDDLLDAVESGEVKIDDPCLRGDANECERVRDVLDWDRESAPIKTEPLEEEGAEPDDDAEDWTEDEADEEPDNSPPPPPSDPGAILYAGHPSFLSYPKVLVLIAAALIGGIWFRDTSNWYFFGGLVTALFGVSWVLLERSMHLYLITPRRVEIITGLIAKSSNEVRIEDIRTINVVKKGLPGLLGVGNVEFASSGGGSVEVSFQDVWAANRIKGLVRRLQDIQDG